MLAAAKPQGLGAGRVRPARAARASRARRGEAVAAVAFLLPALLFLLVLRLYPTAFAIVQSLQKTSLNVFDPPRWAGLDNYRYLLFESPTFLRSAVTTVAFVALAVSAKTVMALLVAVLLSQKGFATPVWRTLVFLPVTVPVAVSTVVWQIALRDDGIVNAVLAAVLGSEPAQFFSSPALATLSVLIILSWIGVGYWMILLVAALGEIPRETRQAAALDGAGAVRAFFEIVLPQLKRPLAFVVVALTISTFFTFVPAAVITQGGPRGSTRYLMFEIYAEAYQNANTNLASAEIVLFAILITAIVTLQFRMISPRAQAR